MQKETRQAQLEAFYLESSLKNEVVLLGMLTAVELYPYLDKREEDGALVAILKMRCVERVSPEKIADQHDIYIQKKKDLLKTIGDTNPEVKMFAESIFTEKTTGKTLPPDARDLFWEIYLELEKKYEVGIIPVVATDHTGVYPTYQIIRKPNQPESLSTDVDNQK